MNETALIFSPHADDAALFCGATLAKFAGQGWHVVLVRITDDCKDSVGLSIEETIRRNTAELAEAAAVMGVAEIVEMGYETDALFAVSELELREKFVHLIRKHRPYAVFSFDPMGLYENNQDHIRVAEAVDEALWVSAFDKHYPEHFAEGLAPFSVCERWFFGRELPIPNHIEDVTDFIDRKIEAACCHRTMIQHMLRQYQLQLETWGRRVPLIDAAYAGDHHDLVAMFLGEQAAAVGRKGGLGEGQMGEAFRLERFGALEGVFQRLSEPIPGRTPVPRPGLDRSPED